jgi:hypothetical protein
MSTQSYTIRTDVKFPPLQLIDVSALAAETKDPWFNQTTTASSTRRAIVGQDNLFATLTYDRDGWERVQRGIDVSEVATASAFPAARPSTRGEPGRATASLRHSGASGLEGIQDFHVETREVTDVARHHRQPVNRRRRRDHRVLVQRVGLAVHQPRPDSERG